MKKFLLILFSCISAAAFATHERAGEITYRCLGGNIYEITITTYTKASSCPADKCSLMVFFGDGDSALAYRKNGVDCNGFPSNCSTINGYPPCAHCGEMVGPDIKKNVYTVIHTYPGGNYYYIIHMTDPNRNDNIANIPGGGVPFSIQDTIVIPDPTIMQPFNNSAILVNPPIDKACSGSTFIHNPGAVDPDGDSLSYSLGVCYQDLNTPVSGYVFPPGVSIDPVTGDFVWTSPPPSPVICDEYNFAIDIREWRLSTDGKRYLVGTVRRDMQVTVCDCDNKPPVIDPVKDTCILANTALTFTVTAHDVNGDNLQLFTASGGPFVTNPSATFSSDVPPLQTNATGVFSWTPSCNQVRNSPYIVTLKATDDGLPDLVLLSDYETFFIRVIAPAPKNLTASPECTSMKLKWDNASCNPTGNGLIRYKIYRKIGCDTLKPGYCETGMPSAWGYTLIATTPNIATSYTDNNGLVHGYFYSYRIVAHYLDGSISYVSDPVCSKLVRDAPIITNVDVASTNAINGSINIQWVKPIADPANFDTIANPGPYKFELLRATGYGTPGLPAIQTFTSPYFASLNTTAFLDTPLNTSATAFTYRLNFYYATTACPSQNASSVFLTCVPNDNQIQITWNEQVPWKNFQYDVYKLNPVTSNWDSIGTTALNTYTDTGIVNGAMYCYKIKSIGAYPDTTLPTPLINWSQELCCSPVDKTPPCAVTLEVDSSCTLAQNILSWNNPNNSCSDDAQYYIIYHTPVGGGDFSVYDTVHTISITTYIDDSLKSIAGCYAITSVDSSGNESAFSNSVCIDNCPNYELPNVFTPNGDGMNDFFTPLHPYKYVEDINIIIYNRWGTEVFRTADPEIMWDGKSSQTQMLCSDGVYYYICFVNDIRLQGIVPRILKGYVHLLGK